MSPLARKKKDVRRCDRCRAEYPLRILSKGWRYCSLRCIRAERGERARMKYLELQREMESTIPALQSIGCNPSRLPLSTPQSEIGKDRRSDCARYLTCINACARADWRDFSCGQCKGYSK